jgi:uncharacterized Tic20 family protein
VSTRKEKRRLCTQQALEANLLMNVKTAPTEYGLLPDAGMVHSTVVTPGGDMMTGYAVAVVHVLTWVATLVCSIGLLVRQNEDACHADYKTQDAKNRTLFLIICSVLSAALAVAHASFVPATKSAMYALVGVLLFFFVIAGQTMSVMQFNASPNLPEEWWTFLTFIFYTAGTAMVFVFHGYFLRYGPKALP